MHTSSSELYAQEFGHGGREGCNVRTGFTGLDQEVVAQVGRLWKLLKHQFVSVMSPFLLKPGNHSELFVGLDRKFKDCWGQGL